MKTLHFSRYTFLSLFLFLSDVSFAQNNGLDDAVSSIHALKLAQQDFNLLSKQLEHTSTVFINSIKKLEKRMSVSTDTLFQINNIAQLSIAKTYHAKLDSFATIIKYTQFHTFGNAARSNSIRIEATMQKLEKLTQEFEKAEKIKYVLQSNLQKLSILKNDKHFKKYVSQYSKLAYTYNTRLNEARNLLSQPDKLGRKLLEQLRSQKAFQKYFAKYSELSKLFPASEGPIGSQPIILGLQQRDELLEHIKTNIGGKLFDPIQLLQNQDLSIPATNPIVDAVKNLEKKIEISSETPLFLPALKGLPFSKRIFFQANVEPSSGSRWLPSYTTLAIGTGYKINSKSQISAEMIWRLGWGQPIKNIRFSHQGLGLRAFLDMKIKGEWWMTSSFERNYYPSLLVATTPTENGWRNSTLMGISKTLSIKNGSNKKFKMQLLYDFMAPSQIPYTSPWKYRVGYIF